MLLNQQSMLLGNRVATKGNLFSFFPNLVEKNVLPTMFHMYKMPMTDKAQTMPMTDKAQTGWDMYFCGRKETRPRTWSSDFRAYVRVRSITPKALLHAVRPLESLLVLVLHLWVIFIGIPQGRQATVEAALGQAVNITIHPLHGITEGQRVTVLIHVGRARWSGNKGEDCYTWYSDSQDDTAMESRQQCNQDQYFCSYQEL